MDVRIGVQHTARELTVDTEQDRAEIVAALEKAIDDDTVLVLEDRKGGSLAIPGAKVAYLEFGTPSGRTVGFGA